MSTRSQAVQGSNQPREGLESPGFSRGEDVNVEPQNEVLNYAGVERHPRAKLKFYTTDSGAREWTVMWGGPGYLMTGIEWCNKVILLPIAGWYPYRNSVRLGDGCRHEAQVGFSRVANGNIPAATDQEIVRIIKTLFEHVVVEGA